MDEYSAKRKRQHNFKQNENSDASPKSKSVLAMPRNKRLSDEWPTDRIQDYQYYRPASEKIKL